MKKVFLYGFLISLFLLALSACTKEQAQELPTGEPQIETAALETPSQKPQAETITTTAPEQTSPEQPEQITTPEPVQQEPEKADPAPAPEPAKVEQPAQVEQPAKVIFTEVNETVYATNTVNIRASYTTASDKIGSLGWGQSIVRTGIGTGEAEGWSRVKLSNGTVAYISSQYLSTTKPVSSGNGNSSSGNGSGGSSGGSGGSTNQNESTNIPDTPDTDGGRTIDLGEGIDQSSTDNGGNAGKFEPGAFDNLTVYG